VKKILLVVASALALVVTLALSTTILSDPPPPRPDGPCDIYGAAGTPCVTAHSTTRALSASYDGPLYQVRRESDGRTLDIGIVRATSRPVPDPGGYADAAAQDAFCERALCVITVVYDQSGLGNHLYQAPPGTFRGPAKGGFNTLPIADMAPVTIGGHKAYGVYIMPGMGLRNNNATGLAIEDEPQGIYMVFDGTHYSSGCCFNYGNGSTNGRAVGTGTMETVYFGTATVWGRGSGPGPWIMSDKEDGLFSGYEARLNEATPTIDTWRFVTGVVNGGGGNQWDLRGGNAQEGELTTYYSGIRPGSIENNRYYPMRRPGAVLLGNGGDNGNGSAGTFYEGVMTDGYPSDAAVHAVQDNIVAARYDVQRLGLTRMTTFTPGSAQEVTATFTNTTGSPISGVALSLALPAGWAAVVSGSGDTSARFAGPVEPGASVNATFHVTSPARTGAGFLTGKAEWTHPTRGTQRETSVARVRNVLPVKINEVRFGTSSNVSDQFIELYNAASEAVDLSNWSLIHTPSEWPSVSLATIPAGTTLASGAFYVLGLASSGLTAPASPGESTINVRSVTGFEPGQTLEIGAESRTIVSVGTAAAPMTTVFIPISTGPWLTVAAGSTNLPVTNATGFEVGEKIGIDVGGSFEVATVTAVGKAATQTTLAAAATAGATNIRLAATANLTVGDTLTVSTGGRKELVTVASVGTPGADGSGVDLAAPLRFDHLAGVDVAGRGTGISFSPATRFPHVSADAVQALGSGITLDRPLADSHGYGTPVVNLVTPTTGYQGPPAPDQWFGVSISPRAGSIALLDASGEVVVDAMVYGSQQSNSSANGTIASPELATLEADQHQGGCIVAVPTVIPGFGQTAPAGTFNRSVGRFPDGRDHDSLCHDFSVQAATTLAAASPAGASNIKTASVAGFAAGQTLMIGTGPSLESATIATVGTPGGTTVATATAVGATVVPVADAAGFSAGQTITLGSGANRETVVVASVTRGRGGSNLTVARPLTMAHAAGAPVSGSGITFRTPLTGAHERGAQVARHVPTPGAPNQYDR
jgi:non-reducing end alpha-L-arabinofuranosidase